VQRQPSITADSQGLGDRCSVTERNRNAHHGALVRCRVQPVIDKADKTLGFTTAAEGVDAILGHYLCAMLGALADGTWGRLKACWNEECRRAFYDRSRNHAGTWCEMACGSVHKMRRLSPSRDPSAVAIDRTPGSSQASRLPPAVSKTRSAGPSAELTSPAPWWRASWTAKFRASRARSSETWASYWAGSSERHPTAHAVAARAVADKKAHRHRRTHRAAEGSSNRA
jgi:hypothetical protein